MTDKKRTVVITGASSGAGRAIAVTFAANGDQLILASRNMAALQELAEECQTIGAEVKCIQTDTAQYHDVINLATAAADFGNTIDVWINNAGVLAVGEFDKTPMEVTEQVIKTNLLGYMNGAHAILPYFKKQGYGILINNISIGGFLPVPYGVGYSASKFGLRGFSAALKAELSAFKNIHICDAFPAFLDTPGIQHAANYTGRQLKPAPPVYDPNRIAADILKISRHPKPSTMMGSTAILLRYAYALAPGLTRGIGGYVISRYLKNAAELPATNGNIFNTVKYGNAVHGGWGIPGKPRAHHKYISLGVLAIAAGIMLLNKSKS